MWSHVATVSNCRQYTHKHCTYSAVQSFHKLGTNTPRLAPVIMDCISSFVCLKRICHLVLHMSHPLLFSHLPFTTSTSSSSLTLPSTTTRGHAAQSVQHGPLEEQPVPHEHLQAIPVDKQRHQESLWRENLQSGGNPRHDISHSLRAQRACDSFKDRRVNRSISFF